MGGMNDDMKRMDHDCMRRIDHDTKTMTHNRLEEQ